MAKRTEIRKGVYFDSVKLMLVTNELNLVEGVIDASIVMGTELNKESLQRMGLLTEEAESAAVTDMIIAVHAETEEALVTTMNKVDELLNAKEEGKQDQSYRPRSIESAVKIQADSNLCIISVPGRYAKNAAMEALNKNMHVMLFSDNVSLEDELELKTLAVENNLLMMGPDCGTAMINNVPLCFSNKVRRGKIGVVAASGTGAQEVMTLIHSMGGGLTQVIGTGGRDLNEKIGGKMMFLALDALNEDPETEVICIVSKPPAPAVYERMVEYIKEKVSKPVVINFLGAHFTEKVMENIRFTSTLEEAARKSVQVAGYSSQGYSEAEAAEKIAAFAEKEAAKLKAGQKYIRGLFSGGTLAYESLFTMEAHLGTVYSNLSKTHKVEDVHHMVGHATVDFGEDEFTNGKPHPMIDPTLRHEVFTNVLKQEDTAVVLMDIVIGYGSHAEPHKVFVDTYRKHIENGGQPVSVVVNICGTEDDPQGYGRIKRELENAGILVMDSNYQAVMLSVKIAEGKRGE